MRSIRVSPRAIITRADRYLVIHYRDKGGEWFVFPGGGQQPGEDLHQALAREVEEEVGVTPIIGKMRFVREVIAERYAQTNLPREFHQLEVYFDCRIERDPTANGATPDANQVGIEWRTIDELRQVRFFPKPMLELLGEEACVYLGAC